MSALAGTADSPSVSLFPAVRLLRRDCGAAAEPEAAAAVLAAAGRFPAFPAVFPRLSVPAARVEDVSAALDLGGVRLAAPAEGAFFTGVFFRFFLYVSTLLNSLFMLPSEIESLARIHNQS